MTNKSVRIVEKPELARLMSPQRNQTIPIHSWYTFKHGYSRDLVINLIQSLNLSKGSWVLDPFCGSGTTLLTCKEMAIRSRGFDILPFSVFLSNVKVAEYDATQLTGQLHDIMGSLDNSYHQQDRLPDIPLIEKAFRPEVKAELLVLKRKIEDIPDHKMKSFLNLAFLGILESVSNTSKSGGFLRLVNRQVSPRDVGKLFLSKAESMINDLSRYAIQHKEEKSVSSLAKIGDARRLHTSRKYDAVVTSPPYPNRHDYTRIYSLEMVFDFVSTNDELKKIRYETLRSHVEARKRYKAIGYAKPARLDRLINEVKNNGTNNPRVADMLEGYFEDMYLCLSEMHRCLKRCGKVALVVSNVRFAGVNIPVDEILAEIGSQVGLSPDEIWAVRYRGNSSQQMRDYKREPSRESIVIWSKDGD